MKFTQSGLRPFVRPIILALALIFSAPCLYTVSAAEYVQGISAGDQILFGYYEQDNDQSNGMESIPWEVLVVEGDRALLISQSNLDCKAFNPEEGSYTWETCALRNWLNSEFLNTAFTEEEREIVRTTAVKNDDNPKYGTNGGGDTQDRIFLLSIAEAQDYFKDDDARRTKNTAYAKAQGAYEEEGFGGWWLRSPGDRESTAATVIGTGSVRRGGRGAHKADRAVRPALWVNIQQLLDLVDAQEFEKSAFSANEAPAAPSTSVLQSGIETKANESEVIWSNVNFHTVQNGAKACYVFFELEQATVVTFIRTCHYLSGGAMPGKLMLYAETGLQWGPFQAIGADGQGDVKNAYWVVDIGGIELPAGRYAVEDSSPETWSSNEESGFEGFLEVFGYAQTADFLGNPFITVGMDPVETTSLLTENDSLASETAGLTQKFAPGDLIAFGHYEQDNDMTNGAEAIYWRVLDLDENKALLISVYNLDCGKYHEQLEAVTWESATLRTWLNSDFLNNAFTEQEQELIMTTVISNEDNSIFGTDGGPDTQDRVFLLSLAEVEEYFYDDDDRHALGTPYAQAQGAVGWDGYGSWWLRSPGKDSDKASYMSNLFCAMSAGNDVDLTNAIRPALYIKLGAESSFGDRENTTMTGIETATLDETPVSVESNPVETTTLLTENNGLASETAVPKQGPSVGELVLFGQYEQDNDNGNGMEYITWRVLDSDENKALLISVYNLDCGKYHEQFEAVTWESATLRTWLNNDFLNTAFTEQEREVIITSVISNEDNPEYGTDGGPDTQDRVFLLSLAEAEEYLCDDDDRRALNTPYAQAQGAIDVDGFGDWWLRSPGNGSDHASCMFYCDKAWVDCCGYEVNISNCALRPAMFIKLGAGISFGDPGNTPMDIETTTLGKTPASVELNPDGTETAGIFAPEALSGLWMVTTTYESWHGEDGVEKDWNLTWSMPVLLEFQTDGQGTWTEMHEWGTLTGFASMENGTIGVSLQANGPVQYDGKIIINVAEKTMEGTMTEESHTDTSMWTKGPWSAIMVADQSELSDCFRELNVGITGKDVAALKTHLYELGYSPFDPGTDNFIESTGEAVAAFEKRNGLPADGIADPVMQALLYSDFAIPNQR